MNLRLKTVAQDLRPALAAMPHIDELNQARLAVLRGQLAGEAPTLGRDGPVDVSRVSFAAEEGAFGVEALLYLPTDRPPACGLLNIHGGGYIAGSAQIDDALLRTLAVRLGCAIVAPDYRLAPENPYPAALQDCYAALRWIKKQSFGNGRLAVRGVSAGGGLALGLALLARDRAEIRLDHVQLVYPMLDDRTGSQAWAGHFVWTALANRFGWDSLLRGHDRQKPSSYAVPGRATDLSDLPSVFLAVGSIDLFARETLELASRLIDAGSKTELHLYPGAYHGFDVVAGSAAAEALARAELAALDGAFTASSDLPPAEDTYRA